MKSKRNLRKKLISVFGRGTYQGILEGVLAVRSDTKHTGVRIVRTAKKLNRFYFDGQFNPYLRFPNIN